MGTKDLTDIALLDALSKNAPLTDEQRSVLMTVVMQRAKQDADADRWRFLKEHWQSLMGGTPLHRWIEEQALRRGGIEIALDYAMNYHYSGERHIA
jgi:hypothetical protein